MRTVYIAGPMTGYPDHNFPAFDAAEKALLAQKYKVHSPAAMDRRNGFNGKYALTSGELGAALIRDFRAIMLSDEVCLLPGWERSQGTMQEILFGKTVGVKFWEFETGQPIDPKITVLVNQEIVDGQVVNVDPYAGLATKIGPASTYDQTKWPFTGDV